jgi:PhzF family phenazine biosynthesis protein
MNIPFFHIDAFADEVFSGNPAGVVLLDGPRDPFWMQKVAAEINLSETAFLEPREGGYGLRWFTPVVEVALCGHATLASAHALWESGLLPSERPARFHTKSGLLTATKQDPWIELDFPARLEEAAVPPPELLPALGLTSTYVGKNVYDYLVLADSEEVLRNLHPDHARLRSLKVRGVIVTALSNDPRFDFVSRFFAPGSGIEEDPVTGSAHCCLGPFWRARLGKSEFVAYQASPRGGSLRVRVEGDRVVLAGRAVTVLRGEMFVWEEAALAQGEALSSTSPS